MCSGMETERENGYKNYYRIEWSQATLHYRGQGKTERDISRLQSCIIQRPVMSLKEIKKLGRTPKLQATKAKISGITSNFKSSAHQRKQSIV